MRRATPCRCSGHARLPSRGCRTQHALLREQPTSLHLATALGGNDASAALTPSEADRCTLPGSSPAAPLPAPTQQQLDHCYGGACVLCGRQHVIRSGQLARAAAAQLVRLLDEYGRLDFASAAPGTADPRFSTDYLWTKGPGRMLGVLVCSARGLDGAAGPPRSSLVVGGGGVRPGAAPGVQGGDVTTVVLKAFSGQMTESWHVPGWVGPVAGLTSTSQVGCRRRRAVHCVSLVDDFIGVATAIALDCMQCLRCVRACSACSHAMPLLHGRADGRSRKC